MTSSEDNKSIVVTQVAEVVTGTLVGYQGAAEPDESVQVSQSLGTVTGTVVGYVVDSL